MQTLLSKVLSVNDIAQINDLVAAGSLVDGRATSVVSGKKNLQLPVDSVEARRAGSVVTERLLAHDKFNAAVLPAALHPPLFSRYEPGMEYPDHIDVAVMGRIRTDVAVTLFLSPLESYDGGALVVDTGNGSRSYRLEAGDAIAYPASTIHRVDRVSRGVRLVAALWIQSLVRDVRQRQILQTLSESMRSCDDTPCAGRLRKSYWNLMRMWAEPAA